MGGILKRTLAVAAALLLIGAGCPSAQEPTTPAPGAPSGEKEGAMMRGADEVDVAADAYLKGSSDDQAAAEQEDGDAALLNSTDSQMNAYGQAYDDSEL